MEDQIPRQPPSSPSARNRRFMRMVSVNGGPIVSRPERTASQRRWRRVGTITPLDRGHPSGCASRRRAPCPMAGFQPPSARLQPQVRATARAGAMPELRQDMRICRRRVVSAPLPPTLRGNRSGSLWTARPRAASASQSPLPCASCCSLFVVGCSTHAPGADAGASSGRGCWTASPPPSSIWVDDASCPVGTLCVVNGRGNVGTLSGPQCAAAPSECATTDCTCLVMQLCPAGAGAGDCECGDGGPTVTCNYAGQ